MGPNCLEKNIGYFNPPNPEKCETWIGFVKVGFISYRFSFIEELEEVELEPRVMVL